MNEIKSEYMVLCESCGQKLENNFTQWRQRNPGGTFDDYRQTVCLTENQLPPRIPAKKKRSFRSLSLKEKILLAAVTVIATGIGSWLGTAAVHAIRNHQQTDKKVLTEQWIRKTYGSYRLTLETPWELKSSTLPLPGNVKGMLENMESFESSDDNRFKVGLIMAKYNPEEINELNMQGAADGAANEVRNMPGVTHFVYSEDSYTVSDLPGFIQRGTYSQGGNEIAFINIGIVKDFNYWQVMVLSGKDDKIAGRAAERIVKSLQIDYLP